MHKVAIFAVCVTCFVSACKPLARQEPVSEEQSIAATFTRHIDQAISLGDFTKIRKWLDDMIENVGDETKNRIAILKVSAVEKVLHRKLLQGDKATIKALFDSYIDKDIAGVKNTITSISNAITDQNAIADNKVRKYLKTLNNQVYEVQAAWRKQEKVIESISSKNSVEINSRTSIILISPEYDQFSLKYENWATGTETDLIQALRTYSIKSGHPRPTDSSLENIIIPKDIKESFAKLIERLHKPWESKN